MKKNVMIITLTILIVVFAGATYIIGGMVYDGTVGDMPYVLAEEMETTYADEHSKLSEYKTETVMISSEKNGYEIETLNISAKTPSDDVMVVVHGITSNYYEVLNTAHMYLENNYNVIVYHQRQTGLTGGDNFTFGLHEQYDLDEVVAYANEVYPQGTVGVHGFSMGAATTAFHTALNETTKHVDFYVLDAPYHTMESAVSLGIKAENVPFVSVKYALWAGNLMINSKADFGYDDVRPIDAVAQTSVPVMLIHGLADTVTSPDSSQLMYDAISHDAKELWLVEGIGHCKVDDEMPEEYEANVMSFIDEHVK